MHCGILLGEQDRHSSNRTIDLYIKMLITLIALFSGSTYISNLNTKIAIDYSVFILLRYLICYLIKHLKDLINANL